MIDTSYKMIDDIRFIISTAYDLNEVITDCLEFFFTTKVGANGNTKDVPLEDDCLFKNKQIQTENDKNIPARTVLLSDIKLHVRKEIGDEMQVDYSCDSWYMLKAMECVGKAIRAAYHWIAREKECYLVMDNAGGHGTNEAIQQYTNNLRDCYNIRIIWQIPRLPYTNMLDLGIWMSLQARVERESII